MQETFAEALEASTQDELDSRTSYARCLGVCPMTVCAGIPGANPSETVSGVLRVLQGDSGTPEAERWAEVCSGSGTCIPACPENVNPRFMLSLARVAMQKRASVEEQHKRGSADFSAMGR